MHMASFVEISWTIFNLRLGIGGNADADGRGWMGGCEDRIPHTEVQRRSKKSVKICTSKRRVTPRIRLYDWHFNMPVATHTSGEQLIPNSGCESPIKKQTVISCLSRRPHRAHTCTLLHNHPHPIPIHFSVPAILLNHFAALGYKRLKVFLISRIAM